MGRYLDSDEVQKLSEAADLSLELYRVDESDIPEDFKWPGRPFQKDRLRWFDSWTAGRLPPTGS